MPKLILESLEEAPTAPAADVGRCLEHLVETLATVHASLAAIRWGDIEVLIVEDQTEAQLCPRTSRVLSSKDGFGYFCDPCQEVFDLIHRRLRLLVVSAQIA